MVFICALGAAIANALTSVFQRLGVEDAPADSTLTLGLMTHALRRGVWLFGFFLMILSFLLQAVALHFGQLSEVQPILDPRAAVPGLRFGRLVSFQGGLT